MENGDSVEVERNGEIHAPCTNAPMQLSGNNCLVALGLKGEKFE